MEKENKQDRKNIEEEGEEIERRECTDEGVTRQHPGDHKDQGGEWETQYGGEEELLVSGGGEAEAAGATMSTPTC